MSPAPKKTPERETSPDTWSKPGEVLGLGLNVVAAAFLFGFLGHWVGSRIGEGGAREALTLLGGFIGAAAGFYSMIRHLTSHSEHPGKKKSG